MLPNLGTQDREPKYLNVGVTHRLMSRVGGVYLLLHLHRDRVTSASKKMFFEGRICFPKSPFPPLPSREN